MNGNNGLQYLIVLNHQVNAYVKGFISYVISSIFTHTWSFINLIIHRTYEAGGLTILIMYQNISLYIYYCRQAGMNYIFHIAKNNYRCAILKFTFY